MSVLFNSFCFYFIFLICVLTVPVNITKKMLCKSFVIILMMLELFDCAKNESEPRFVPPPPPFAPPLLYPVNAATGILVAIAIPVPLPSQSVFVSYNFEANYNMPNAAPDSFPGKIDRWTVGIYRCP